MKIDEKVFEILRNSKVESYLGKVTGDIKRDITFEEGKVYQKEPTGELKEMFGTVRVSEEDIQSIDKDLQGIKGDLGERFFKGRYGVTLIYLEEKGIEIVLINNERDGLGVSLRIVIEDINK